MIERKPVVFINNAIENIIDDSIGFDDYVSALQDAVKTSKIIGIIGEHGSGKSSLINLLCKDLEKKENKYVIKTLTFLHYIEVDSKKRKEKYDAKELLKILIQNLSFGLKKDYVNKVLSNNYGELSFSFINNDYIFYIFLSFFFILLIKLSSFYINITNIATLAMNNFLYLILYKLLYILNSLNDSLIYICLGLIAFGLMKSKATFSLWDSQGKRKIGEEELISLFENILADITNENATNIIIIDDLDRIEDPVVIKDFLKLIYKISLSENVKKNSKFIIALKRTDNINSIKEENKLFIKIFDFQIDIKKINRIDFTEYILTLLRRNENVEYIKSIFKNGIDEYPSELNSILEGKNVSFREIKKRLNNTFLLYNSLFSTNNSGYISIESCARISYLESEFSVCMENLTKDEDSFDKLEKSILKGKYEYTNNDLGKEGPEFVKILEKLIISNSFGMNPRMYFYRYPKGAFIANYNQNILLKILTEDNDAINELESIVKDVLTDDIGRKIIENHAKLLIENKLIPYKVIHENLELLELFISVDSVKVLEQIQVEGIYPLNNNTFISETEWYLKMFRTEKTELIRFCQIIIFMRTNIKTIDNFMTTENFYKLRIGIYEILDNNLKLIEHFYSKYFPIISENEIILFINNVSIENLLNSINIELIDKVNQNYIIKNISLKFNQSLVKQATEIFDRLTLINLTINNEYYINFLILNNILDKKYQEKIIFKDRKDSKFIESFINYLELFRGSEDKISISIFQQMEFIDLEYYRNTKLVLEIFLRGDAGYAVRLIVKNSLFSIIDFRNPNNTSKFILGLTDNIPDNKEVLEIFRKYLVFKKPILLNNFKIIFQSTYPRMNRDELITFHYLKYINDVVEFENIDTLYILDFITVINRSKKDTTSIKNFIMKFHNYVNKNYLKNNSLISIYINNIDFEKLTLKDIEEEIVHLLFDCFYLNDTQNKLTNNLNVIKKLNYYDTRQFNLSNEFGNEEVRLKLCEIIKSTSDDYGKIANFIKKVYLDDKFDDRITKIMFDNNDILNYLTSKILNESYVFEINDIEYLLKIFINTKNARGILLLNKEFTSVLSKQIHIEYLKDITNEEFKYFPINVNTLEILINKYGVTDELAFVIFSMRYIENESEVVDYLLKSKKILQLNHSIIDYVYSLVRGSLRKKITLWKKENIL